MPSRWDDSGNFILREGLEDSRIQTSCWGWGQRSKGLEARQGQTGGEPGETGGLPPRVEARPLLHSQGLLGDLHAKSTHSSQAALPREAASWKRKTGTGEADVGPIHLL